MQIFFFEVIEFNSRNLPDLIGLIRKQTIRNEQLLSFFFSVIGWLYDVLGSYNPGFYLSGSNIAVSGLMLFVIPYVQRRCERKEMEKMTAVN